MTLIEVLVALMLFALVFIAILPNFFVLGYSTIFTMGGKTQAVAEANEIMDSIFMSGKTPEDAIDDLGVSDKASWSLKENPVNTAGKELFEVTVTTEYWDNDAEEFRLVTIKSIMPMSAP